MLKELANDCWFHKPCQGIQDGDTVCCYWVAYISGKAGIDTKGGMKGGTTMVGPGAVTRACYCGRQYC
jgi:hypothetical protein